MAIYSLMTGMKRIDVPKNHAKNQLPRGTILKLSGYCDPEYVITGTLGVTETYGAMYSTIHLGEFTTGKKEAFGMKPISEKGHNGIQMYYTTEVLPENQILDIEAYSIVAMAYQDAQKKTAAELKAKAKDALPAKYPHLETEGNSKKTGRVLAASNIRRQLKRKFPDVKFSVKSESYSGGCSVDVSWTDGPTSDQIAEILNPYQYGNFDGMTDCYNHNENNNWGETFGDAMYVHGHRHLSGETIKTVAKDMGFDVNLTEYGSIELSANIDDSIEQMIYREARSRAY